MSQPPQPPFPGDPNQGQFPQGGGGQYPQGGGGQYPQGDGGQFPQGGGGQYPQGGPQQPPAGGQFGQGPGGIQFDNQVPGQQPPQKGGFLKSVGGRILGAVLSLVLVVVLALGFTVGRNFFDKKGLEDQVGKCAVLTGTGNDVDTEEIDCASEDFHYKIVATAESENGCPDGNYTTLTTTRTSRGSSTTVGTLCMMADLAKDKCYTDVGTSGSNELAAVDCADSNALFKIAEILEENDVSKCTYPDASLSYSEPPRTYCAVAPNE